MRDDHDTARPSPRAVERLADTVGAEVRDLRGALQRALDAADRHEADGREDLAVAVLEEQRELLVLVHQRLQTELAGAAVEREAEAVLAAVDVPAEEPAAEAAPAGLAPIHLGDHAGSPSGRAMVGRLLASAAAAVLGLALLIAPDGSGGQLSIAGARSSEPQLDPATDRAEISEVAQTEARAAAAGDQTVAVDTEAPSETPDGGAVDEPATASTGGAMAAEGSNGAPAAVGVDSLGVENPTGDATIPTIAPDPAGEAASGEHVEDDEDDEDDDASDEAPSETDGSRDPQTGRDEALAPDGDGSSTDGGPEGSGPRPPVVGGGMDAPGGGTPPTAQPSTPGAVGDGQAAASE